MSAWWETDEAKRLLAELDAAERSSDCYLGWGWSDVSRSFAERAKEIEHELDDLRNEAVEAIADAVTSDRYSDEWIDAECEANRNLDTVEWIIGCARRQGWGDGLIEQAAAA